MYIDIKIINKDFYKCKSINPTMVNEYGHLITAGNLPKYQTRGSVGLDLYATQDYILLPNTTQLISTGLAVHIKDDTVGGFIYPRSGLGHKSGIVLGNLVGLIDSDYQDELKISLWNRSEEVRYVNKGDRIAQIVFQKIEKVHWNIVDEFSQNTDRTGGFGSTDHNYGGTE